MLTENNTIGWMGNAHGAENGKQGMKKASCKLEMHSNFRAVDKGTLLPPSEEDGQGERPPCSHTPDSELMIISLSKFQYDVMLER